RPARRPRTRPASCLTRLRRPSYSARPPSDREERTPLVAGPGTDPVQHSDGRRHGREGRRSGARGGGPIDLTGPTPTAKLVGLPRRSAGRPAVGARPLLENSTACQKSMPNTPSPGWRRTIRSGATSGRIPLVKTDDSCTSAFSPDRQAASSFPTGGRFRLRAPRPPPLLRPAPPAWAGISRLHRAVYSGLGTTLARGLTQSNRTGK